MQRLAILLLVLFTAITAITSNSHASRSLQVVGGGEKRLALVIGNSNYESVPLKNPANDARDMADQLERLGFDVILETNAVKRTMLAAMERFGRSLRDAKVGLFFFAGHGMQVKGINYLIPVGAYVRNETDVEIEGVDSRRILGRMKNGGADVNIIFLDACRDNPFNRSFRSVDRGLARMDAPKGTFIAYATGPGSVAEDGEGRNSPFTRHMVKYIATPGLPIESLLKRVRQGVLQETGENQMPWQSSSLTGDFYFASSGAVVDAPVVSPNEPSGQGGLSVEANVSGAIVYIDGNRVGTTPLKDTALSPGQHVVLVTATGYQSYQKRVRVDPGRTASIYVDLSTTVTTVSTKGRIYVDTEPTDATVKIHDIGTAFSQGMELEVGRYQVEVSASGHDTKKLLVELSENEDKRLTVRLEPATTEYAIAKETKLTIEANIQEADIEINGRYFGKAPNTFFIRKAGNYQIRISKDPDYDPWSKSVDVALGDDHTVTANLTRKTGPVVSAPSVAPSAEGRIGETWKDPVTDAEFVWVPGGCFQMGCGSWTDSCYEDEKPVHEVCVDGFWMGIVMACWI